MDMVTNKLKPCPFCGDDNPRVVETTFSYNEATRIKIECGNCGATVEIFGSDVMKTSDGYLKLGPDAIEKWNRRAGE